MAESHLTGQLCQAGGQIKESGQAATHSKGLKLRGHMTGSAGQVSSLKDCWPIETPSGLARDYLQYLMLQYLMLNLSFVFWINLLLIHGLRQLPQMRPRVLHPSPTNASSHQYMKFSILWGRHATDSCSYRKYVYYILCIHPPVPQLPHLINTILAPSHMHVFQQPSLYFMISLLHPVIHSVPVHPATQSPPQSQGSHSS